MMKKISLIAIVALTSFAFIAPKLKAQTGSAALTLSPTSGTVTEGSTGEVDIVLNTGSSQVNAITAAITVSGVIPPNINATNEILSNMNGETFAINNGNGTWTVGVAFLATAAGSTYSTNGQAVTIGSIVLPNAPASGQTTMVYSFNDSGVYVSNQGSSANILQQNSQSHTYTYTQSAPNPTNTPIPSNTPTPTPTSPPPTNNGTLTLNPTSQSYSPGSSVSINIRANTGNNSASSITAAFTFSGSMPSSFAAQTANLPNMSGENFAVNNGNGTYTVGVAFIGDSASSSYSTNGQNTTIGTISFTAPSSGQLTASLDNAASGIYVSSDGSAINILQNSTTTYTYTISGTTPSVTPSPTVTQAPLPTIIPGDAAAILLFHLQGITQQSTAQNLTVSLYEGSTLSHTFSNRTAMSDADGFYAITIDSDDNGQPLQSGNYRLCVKAKSHLQRCLPLNAAEVPQECQQPEMLQPITIQAGIDNNFNLASDCQKLLAGDVDHDNDLDIFDFSKTQTLYTDIFSPVPLGTPEDIDNNGGIDIHDLSLIIINTPQNLLRHGDE